LVNGSGDLRTIRFFAIFLRGACFLRVVAMF
jgi:hypothetical protein